MHLNFLVSFFTHTFRYDHLCMRYRYTDGRDMIVHSFVSCCWEQVQGSTNRRAPGLVNVVPALAYHFCLNLPAAFTQPGAHLLVEPCTVWGGKLWGRFCEIFSESSTSRWAVLHLSCYRSRQGILCFRNYVSKPCRPGMNTHE